MGEVNQRGPAAPVLLWGEGADPRPGHDQGLQSAGRSWGPGRRPAGGRGRSPGAEPQALRARVSALCFPPPCRACPARGSPAAATRTAGSQVSMATLTSRTRCLPPPPAGLAQSQLGCAAAGTEGALELPPCPSTRPGHQEQTGVAQASQPSPACHHLPAPLHSCFLQPPDPQIALSWLLAKAFFLFCSQEAPSQGECTF